MSSPLARAMPGSLGVTSKFEEGFSRCAELCDWGSRPAQEPDDAGEIARAMALSDIEAVERGRLRAERRGGVRAAGCILRELEVLQHHRGGEAGLVVAIGRRGRHRTRHRAIAGHRPTLTGAFR